MFQISPIRVEGEDFVVENLSYDEAELEMDFQEQRGMLGEIQVMDNGLFSVHFRPRQD